MTVKTWRDLADMYRRSEEFFRIQNTIVQAILGLLTVLAILNTVGMTVYERTGEIGTVRSLGVTRAGIVSQFMLEGLYLGLLGALIGSALGVVAISGINAAGFMTAMPGASTDIPIQADVVLSAFMIAALMGLFSTLIGTFVPAWRASRLSVVDALRRNM
jgi:putative ABC transport system permease protein